MNTLTAREAAQIAALGMVIVFFMLIMLFLLIITLRRVMAFARKSVAADTPPPLTDLVPVKFRRRATDIARGEMKTNYIDGQTTALLLAIVAGETEIPIDRLDIKSVTRTGTGAKTPLEAGKKYAFEVKNEIKKGGGGQMKYIITLNEDVYTVEVSENTAMLSGGGAEAPPSQKKPEPAPSDGGAVISPLPGVCVKINVKAGDTVSEGDIVAVIEAMKMENEVPSTHSGKVTEICVKTGEAVNTGDELIKIG